MARPLLCRIGATAIGLASMKSWAVQVLLPELLMNSRPLPAIRGQSAPAALRRAIPAQTSSLPDEESGTDWRRIVSALSRFKWVVALMVALGLGAAFGATRVLRPVYRAQANVWVDVPNRRGA